MSEYGYCNICGGCPCTCPRPYPEPRSMIDYCDQSTEGVGQGFNARFGSGESGGYCDQSTEEQPEQGRASSWEFVCLLIPFTHLPMRWIHLPLILPCYSW